MRWFLALLALAAGAWYLRSRQRRAQVEDKLYKAMPSSVRDQVKDTVSSLGNTAKSTADTVVQRAQEVAQGASKTLGDAAATVQEASGAAVDRARQAAETAGVGAGAEEEAEEGTGATTGSAAETDQNEAPPSLRDTVQAEMADIGEQVDNLRAQAAAPPDEVEKSAQSTFGQGSLSATELRTATAPGTAAESAVIGEGASGTPAEATQEQEDNAPAGLASEGQRPRPIAGEGTTTATGGAVHPLSPVSDGATATGVAEPLPEGLTPGEPGTGGPRGSTQAPSVPDSTETPTIGMEQPPEIDRAAEVAERTSGNIIGNKNTRVFHAATANNLPGESNRVYFETEEEALAAGFRPAENEDLESASS